MIKLSKIVGGKTTTGCVFHLDKWNRSTTLKVEPISSKIDS